VARLERRRYPQAHRPPPAGRLEDDGVRPEPENLSVDETVRFEGASDPEDQAVLFALRSRDDRVRGTFVASFGPQVEPANAAVIQRLAPAPIGS